MVELAMKWTDLMDAVDQALFTFTVWIMSHVVSIITCSYKPSITKLRLLCEMVDLWSFIMPTPGCYCFIATSNLA